MKATDFIADFLRSREVPVVFELVGGMITHMVDSMYRRGGPRILSVHHEQSAAFAADAMGRLTGIPGVALATSGPGATNLLTGIGSCHFDSSPAVFITGQVNRHELKGNRNIRQLGFQETDIVAMAKPITKLARLIDDPMDIPRAFAEAFDLAVAGRPGPVLLDIPMDVQRADIPGDIPPHGQKDHVPLDQPAFWDGFFETLARSKRPMILAGGGVRSSRSMDAFRRFARTTGIPVVSSLNAVDALPYDDPLRVGMIGSYGNRWANLALAEADLLIVLGSRLDIRQTGNDTDTWKGERHIIHVDVESGEMNNRVLNCETVLAHLSDFFLDFELNVKGRAIQPHDEWVSRIHALRAEWPDTGELPDIQGINPNSFIHDLSRATRYAGSYIADVGQHQMWAAQSVELTESQNFMTSGGMGSMGFALPAALGAALAEDRAVVVIAGDGGFQCNIQELQTIRRNDLPVKIAIINNRCHGMVRQFQESYFDCRYQSTLWGYDAPDFARVAEAYGIPGRTVSEASEVEAALQWLAAEPDQPALLQVMIDTGANAYPKIAFGRPMTEMEPFATPLEMEGT